MRALFIPWKFLIGRAARAFGTIDPLTVLASLRRFSQPSEVQEPIELLREGIKFHARGLVNTKAIQHNMDWIWPFWVEKQFNPADPSFIPRAFSFSHINLTHRNWTAVGLPELDCYPIVDPRGLITPFHNGWSIDFWVLPREGDALLPSRLPSVVQTMHMEDTLSVETRSRHSEAELSVVANLREQEDMLVLYIDVHACSETEGLLVAALRPYNPEGVQFIETIQYRQSTWDWFIDSRYRVSLGRKPNRVVFSRYQNGDVLHRLTNEFSGGDAIRCEVGMATSAAVYELDARRQKWLDLRIPVHRILNAKDTTSGWDDCLKPTARLRVPDERIRFLYDAATRCLVLLSAGEVVPGPFTYRRFWFRDACFMIAALLDMGMTERCRRHILRFPHRQKPNGFFHSQAGEWDSNGQVLWIYDRFEQCSQDLLDEDVLRSMARGVKWIENKRIPQNQTPYDGLLPAGFSAEHLGPNDHYYWDNFWSLAGLEAAVRMMQRRNKNGEADRIQALAAEYRKAIFHSIETIPEWRSRGGIPAAPGRRMDAGAVGSMVADYPLNLVEAEDQRWDATLDFLLSNCFHNGTFFQDMIHSGQNAYLTLAIAQSLLRRGDKRFRDLVASVADMASPTGQWPEAVHPITGGGCMGDGQHGWAAAEWIRMIRSLFVREEGDRLVIGSGVFPEWLETNTPAFGFGPTPTVYGPIAVSFAPSESGVSVRLDSPNGAAVRGDIRIPGHMPVSLQAGKDHYELQRGQS